MIDPTTTGRSVTDGLAGLRDAAAQARRGMLDPHTATAAVIAADELIAALGLLAFPVAYPDERLEQVVVTVHGIDVSIRGRRQDMFVHIEDQRDDQDRTASPLTVDVNDTGEVSYAETDHGTFPLRASGRNDDPGRPG
jgi:hypothetical protein